MNLQNITATKVAFVNTSRKITFPLAIIFGLLLLLMFSACSNSDNEEKEKISSVKMADYTIQKLDEAASIKIMTYSMTNVLGKKADATALVFYPKTAVPADGQRIVAWAHGTVGVADGCAISNNALGENFLVAARDLLKNGYVVVAPDYEGLGTAGIHPYLHLQSEAYSVIDAVKAIKEYSPKDFHGNWMVAGQSQGGQAALGVAEYANSDTNFKGAVAGAPASGLGFIITEVAPDALAQIETQEIAGSVTLENRFSIAAYATLLTYGAFAAVGIKAYEPEFDYTIMFNERAGEIAKFVEGTNGDDGECLDEIRNKYIADIINYMKTEEAVTLLNYNGINTEIFANNITVKDFLEKKSQPGTTKIDKPVLVIQGIVDTSVPYLVTDAMVKGLIALGSENVTFLPVKDAGHTEAIVWKNKELQEFITKYMPAK